MEAFAEAEAAVAAGDVTSAVEAIAQAVRAKAGDAAALLRAGRLHLRLDRHASAFALAQAALDASDDPAIQAEAVRLAEHFHVTGASAAAAALLLRCWRAVPGRLTTGLFLAAGLPTFQRSLQEGADIPLLEAMVGSTCRDPGVPSVTAVLELARLVEDAGREELLMVLGAAAQARGLRALVAELTRPGIGAVQGATGLVHAATHRPGRAAIAFASAQAALPVDASARLNAGYAALAGGDTFRAEALFSGLRAAGDSALAGAAWPHFGELPWPFAGPPAAARRAFAARLPPGLAWPRIRLVTPCLNPGPWLEETILSVAAQGYPAVEHVVVDGGSTDGTAEVLARHRDRLHAVIVERDGGPAEAIQKGFAGTEAELIGWINADDLLAPGALHMLGARWAASPEADLVHGWAVAHRQRRITGLQQPLAGGQDNFTIAGLADVFGRWGSGAFFLQPEVLVARRFWEKLGGRLDTTLSAVFDYELWLRAARAGARIAQARWPVAFYRLHAAQRSGQRAALALEQVTVRDRFATPAPPPARRNAVTAALRIAFLRSPGRAMRLLLIDPRCAETLSASAREEARLRLAERQVALDILPRPPATGIEADLVLRLVGAHDGVEWVARLRAQGFRAPVIGWFLEDDRDAASQAAMALAPDIVVPSRARRRGILLQDHALVTEAVEPPCGLVSVAEARAAFAAAPDPGAEAAAWESGTARLHAALREDGPMEVADAAGLTLALLAGREPVATRPGLAELLPPHLPQDRAARHELGLDRLLAPRLLALLDRLRALG